MTSASFDSLVPASLERALLELVSQGGDKASWRWLATHLPRYDVPSTPDLLTALKALQSVGFMRRQELDNGMDRWSLSDEGRRRLVELQTSLVPQPSGPLTRSELAALLSALRAGPEQAVSAFIPHAHDGVRMSAILRQALEADASLAAQVAFGGAMLPPSERAVFANELLDDSRVNVREAVFGALQAKRLDVPGQAVRTLPQDEWDALLRRGLRDSEASVRSAAAALTFGSNRGDALEAVLLANVPRAQGDERHFTLLALGAAKTRASYDVLARAAAEDGLDAPIAVRALAARHDGHEVWQQALLQRHGEVFDAAVFALARVAVELSPETVTALAADGRPQVASALAAYHARTRANAKEG